MEKQVKGKKMTDQQQFWEILIQEVWCSGLHQKELVDFDANEKKLGSKIGSSHRMCLQRHNLATKVQTTLLMCGLQQALGCRQNRTHMHHCMQQENNHDADGLQF